MNKLKELINKLCPNGVEYKNIQELCKISRGKVMSKDFIKFNAGEYPVYSSQTENNGELGKISTYDFDGEYLTWTTDGANAGSVFYRKGKFSVTNVCGLLEVKNKVMIPKFLYYVLSIEAPKYVNAGMGNPKLMSNVMAKIKVPVPPLEVQCEIVHILDDFTLLSAELSAELKAREKQYDYYTEKIWSYLENEKRVRLDTICEIGDGLHGTPEYENNTKLWFINGNNLENGRIIINKSTKEISNKSYNKYNGNYKIGTILMSINGTIGKIAYYTGEKIILGKSAAYFEVIEENTVCNKYLYYYLQSKKALQYFENNKTGSTIKNLGLKALREMKIPFPNRGKQEEIAGKLEKLDKLCNDISEGLPAEIEARQKQYEYYRDKLLTFKELKVNE